jgi:hypothetical protein
MIERVKLKASHNLLIRKRSLEKNAQFEHVNEKHSSIFFVFVSQEQQGMKLRKRDEEIFCSANQWKECV